MEEDILKSVASHYLTSGDFNGITLNDLMLNMEFEWDYLHSIIVDLINKGLVGVINSKYDVNPHIIRWGLPPIEDQITLLDDQDLFHTCVYPLPEYLERTVDKSEYSSEPYTLCLVLGEPQLAYKSFDLNVLEIYRNDPRYYYDCDDVNGRINVNPDFSESNDMKDEDKVLLDTFGFAYDEDLNRAVAAFVRYLSDLSAEHQQIWKAKELTGEYKLHPDYYRNTILGEFGERVSIFSAFVVEVFILNQMSEAMGRPHLFKQDYGKYGENKPQNFGFLVRPTLEEFNKFVHLLDKMLSENIDRDFFQKQVPYESETVRKDGKVIVTQLGSLSILDSWIRKYFQTSDWSPWKNSITTLKRVRKMRQKPAHVVNENEFDQEYFRKQRELIIDAYEALREIRLLFANHRLVKATGIEVPKWLYNSEIWTY